MSEIEILRQEIRELKAISLISQKDALSVEDACLLTGLSKQTLYDYCSKRVIPHYKSRSGKKTYFNKKELNDWMLSEKVLTEDQINVNASRRIYLGN